MFNQLYLVLLLAPLLVSPSSATASNRTDDAALFSSSLETVLGAKGGHLASTAAPVVVKHAAHQAPEEHSKLASLITSKGNASSESTSHKIVETTKLEPAKSAGHSATNSTKVEISHAAVSGNKSDSAHPASHNVSSTVKVEAHKLASTKAPVSVSVSSAPTVDKIASTIKHAVSSAASKPEEHGHANETIHKFCDYIKPICESADKIVPKSLFKIQTQFKHIVHLTSGKLSTCFSEHFSFDPNLKPVSVAELKTICSSKSQSSGFKGSYKAFSDCAAAHWNPAVDKELDRIIEARINCTKNHNHSKNATTDGSVSLGDHDSDDEMSIISEVVSKVLEGDKSASSAVSKNSDIKVIDFSPSTTHKPATGNSSSSLKLALSHASTTSTPTNVKSLLNDPNTVVVFLDDSKTTKKSAASELSTKVKVNTTSGGSSTTSKPAPIHSAVKLDLPSNVKLTLGLNKEPTPSPSPSASKATSSSLAHKILPSESSGAPSSKPVAASTTVKPSSSSQTTKKVEIVVEASKSPASKVEIATKTSSSSTGSSTVVKAASTAAPPTVLVKAPPPPKPLESITELMVRQEKEKSEFESKLRAEREKMMKQLQKKQDEFEAQNAIKSLQIQREASANHDSESRLHQLEHERQMTIDPVGHTMKHQQYEMSKQQKVMSG